MPVIEVRRLRWTGGNNHLQQHSRNVASQTGQDGMLEKIFEIMPPRNNWCVEFGAWDGKYLSNTWNLVQNHGWSAVLIEGNEERFPEIAENHKGNSNVYALNAFVQVSGEGGLDDLLSRTPIPEDFDFLSIDIDGNDYHVWQSLERYRPRLLCIEFNPTVPNNVVFVQDPEPKLRQGCSLLALIELGKQKGYELIATSSWDAFFVPADEYAAFGITENSIDMMYRNEEYVTHLFQGYDGTFFSAGNRSIQWAQIPFAQDEIQLLPKYLRR